MDIAIAWGFASLIVAMLAAKYGRSAIVYLLLALVLSPLLMGLLLLVRGKAAPTALAGHTTAPGQARCPDCRELIRADARKCKHCGSPVTRTQTPLTPRAHAAPAKLPPNW